MNRSELYYKTITTLNDAWRNGSLRKGNCKACAVGNMLGSYEWDALFSTFRGRQVRQAPKQAIHKGFGSDYVQKAVDMIDASGYTPEELMRVEFTFETAREGKTERQSQYNGLCAVFEVLQQIHEVEFSIAQTSKEELDCIYELLN